MLGCKVFLEGNRSKEEGIIQYAGYDLFIVKASNHQLRAGEVVQCMVMYEGSMDSFVSTVIKRDSNSVHISTPPILRDKWMIPREHTRIPFELSGRITAVSFTGEKPLIELLESYSVQVHDISEGGIGFSCEAYLREKGLVQVSFQLHKQSVYLDVEIVNYIYSNTDKRFYYGGRFVDVSSFHYEIIRNYIMKEQMKQLD